MIATATAVAFVVFSCKRTLDEAEKIDLTKTPFQRVEQMFVVQTKNGNLQMRVEAGLMERYENDTASYELFPEGMEVYAYSEDGALETMLLSDKARHYKQKNGLEEYWAAFGNVVVQNIIKQETLETDTLYWDQARKEIYTDCYVRMFSNDGFMQGYGMRSDDHARNAILRRPFNSYGVTEKDTTKIVIDSVNFIGPFKKKR